MDNEEIKSLLLSMNEKIDNNFEKNQEELVHLRQSMVRLEVVLTEKIEALFDAREVSNDKFKEHEIKMSSIENTLDWHDRRLVLLETNKK